MLPPPPIFNLTIPPEPILELSNILEISQELLALRSNKCNRVNIITSNFDRQTHDSNDGFKDLLIILYSFLIAIFILTVVIIVFIR